METLIKSMSRPLEQRTEHKCKYCNNLSPSSHEFPQNSLYPNEDFNFSGIWNGILNGCGYCHLIGIATYQLFPEFYEEERTDIVVDIWVQAGRPVEITFVIWGPWEYGGGADLRMEIYEPPQIGALTTPTPRQRMLYLA